MEDLIINVIIPSFLVHSSGRIPQEVEATMQDSTPVFIDKATSSRTTSSPSRLKILHVITRLICGGADENTIISCNGQAARGHRVTLIHGPWWDKDIIAKIDARVQRKICPHLVWPIRPTKDVKALLWLVSYMGAFKPNIVHTHTSKAGVLGRLAAYFSGVEKIIHSVHILPFLGKSGFERLAYLTLEKLCAKVTHCYIDVSQAMRAECLAHGLGTHKNHFVVPSGMDIGRFRRATPDPEFRAQSNLVANGQAVVALMVSAFEPRKRHTELLCAMSAALMENPRLIVAFAGEGYMKEKVMRLAVSLGIANQVMFLGFRSDVERIIKGADLCILASTREGLPRVVIQYVLAGAPIVVTALPGVEDVVREGENGLIVPVDDLKAFAESVVSLCNNQERRVAMAAASSLRDLDDWDMEKMNDRIMEAYEETNSRGTEHTNI